MTAMLIATTVGVGVLTGLAVRRWLAVPARVESSSMEPTLRAGQRLVVRRVRGIARIARGDVLVVRSDEIGRAVVKRAIGLPGEHIDLEADGRVRVDGHRLTEGYARLAPGRARSFSVPDGSLFLLGDNRGVSSDSRTWRQPYVPERAVIGRVVRPQT